MVPIRKRKLQILVFIVFIISAMGLVLYALRQNISLFYSPTEVHTGKAPFKQRIRVGGMVEKGSIVREKEGLGVRFTITDFSQTLTIHYQGILPDLFREGQGIVAEGVVLTDKEFKASQVLAKHDANYMPPQVTAMLKQPRLKVYL